MARPRSKYLDLDLYDYFYYLTRQIPEGMVSTYGDLAEALGDRIASKAVAEMISIARKDDLVPVHRIVFMDGSVGNRSHSEERTRRVIDLRAEGIAIANNRIVDLDGVRFTAFDTDRPLEKMKQEQLDLQRFIETSGMDLKSRIAAFDVSYSRRNSYAVMVEETGSGHRISTGVGRSRVPYIPGFLAYREFPAIKELCQRDDLLLLFDGNGLLHPRRMGLATFAGIMLHSSSIGVAKSQTSSASGNEVLMINGRAEGFRLSDNVIVSPGHKTTLEETMKFYRERFGSGYPDILRVAHNETVRLRKSFQGT